MSQTLTALFHLIGMLAEIGVQPIFDSERLGCLRAGYALVESARYLRIDLTDFPVQFSQLALKIQRYKYDYRHYDKHATSEYRIEYEHNGRRADRICKRPRDLVYVPRDRRRYDRCVAHNARMKFAYAVLIEVRHRQRL